MAFEAAEAPGPRELGRRIMDLREEVLEMDREEFAESLGCSTSTLAKWEQGVVRMPAEALIQIAMAANVSMDWLARPSRSDHVWAVDQEHVEAAKKDRSAPDVRRTPLWRLMRRHTRVMRTRGEMVALWREITGEEAHPDWF